MDLDEFLDRAMYLTKNPTPEMIARRNEKKKVYYIQISNGYRVYNGVDFCRMVFKCEVTRKEFNDIMKEAAASDNRYADLLDKSFWEKHNIESVEVIPVDYKATLEEKIRFIKCDPEAGEEFEVTHDGRPIRKDDDSD